MMPPTWFCVTIAAQFLAAATAISYFRRKDKREWALCVAQNYPAPCPLHLPSYETLKYLYRKK